jgi:hypothetical protein
MSILKKVFASSVEITETVVERKTNTTVMALVRPYFGKGVWNIEEVKSEQQTELSTHPIRFYLLNLLFVSLT